MRSWRIIAGFLISGVFLFISLRGQDFGAVADSLREVNYWLILLALPLYILGIAVRALRWSVLLRPIASLTVKQLVPINAVGLMANNVLPLRTGEVVRAYALSTHYGVSKSSTLGTIAVERIFDGITMLLFIAVSMIFVTLTSELRHVTILAVVLFTAALAVMALLAHGGEFRDRFLRLVMGPLPDSFSNRATRMADSFFEGLGVFRNRAGLALVSGLSILAWLIEAGVYWLVAHAFGGELAAAMKIPETLLTVGIANLSTLIPSSPGYVGPFEAAIILVVHGAMNLPRELALSYAVLLHSLLYFPVTIWGIFEWSRLHLSLRQVEKIADGTDSAASSVNVSV
jgi:glycosyltransferase 2 family protein